jgi:hypothetical protein
VLPEVLPEQRLVRSPGCRPKATGWGWLGNRRLPVSVQRELRTVLISAPQAHAVVGPVSPKDQPTAKTMAPTNAGVAQSLRKSRLLNGPVPVVIFVWNRPQEHTAGNDVWSDSDDQVAATGGPRHKVSLTPEVLDVLRLLHRCGLTSSDHAPPSPHNFVERVDFEGNCMRIRKLGERTVNRCPKDDSLVMQCICHRQHSWPMIAVPGHAANARSTEELQALGHRQRPEAVEVTHRSLRLHAGRRAQPARRVA